MAGHSGDYDFGVGRDRRQQLLEAGAALAVRQRWQEVLAGVDTRSITDAAGVTTGSFFHHFRNRAHFADALVDRFVFLWDESIDELVATIDAVFGDEGPGAVRDAAESDWRTRIHVTEVTDLEHLLWAARDQPLSAETSITAGEVLAGRYQALTDQAVPAYRRALSALGREMLPPFDEVDIAVALTAIIDGLQMRFAVDPASVRDELFADLVAALVVATTRPAGERAEPVELATLETQLSVPRTDRRPVEGARESWRQIADAAAPLFSDRSVNEVKVAEIASAAGVSTSTVYHQFGTVGAAAASGFARYFPELETISKQPLTAEEGPIVRLEQVLTRFVELGKQHRGAVEGLVLEVLAETAPNGASRPRSIRSVIPLVTLLDPHVRELRARGLLRRRIDGESLARSMLQLVSMRVLMSPDEAVERIIDETAGLLLEGALVRVGQ